MKDDQPQSGALIEFGPFSSDTARGKLSEHGTLLKLGGMPGKILVHLVERPGQAVSRGELQKLLRNGAAFGDFEQGLSSAVNVVRRTLSDSADRPQYIETVPGQGYRFIAPLHSGAAVPKALGSNGALDTPSIAAGMSQGVEGPSEIREAAVGWNATARRRRWGIVGVLTLAALGAGAFWAFQPKPQALLDGSTPSANHEANDQYNLAWNFLVFQNDIPLARKTFERALELDARFTSARLQHANMQILEIYNGYTNDESVLYRVEEEVHQAEQVLPASDGLLIAVQSMLYLAQGRLDRIPLAKVEEWVRNCANNG